MTFLLDTQPVHRFRAAGLMLTLLLGVALGLSACSGGQRITASTPAEAYQQGADLFAGGKYSRAIEHLQAVFDFGRAHEYAADAQLMLADAYFAQEQYLLAANEYDRFIQLYRGDPRVEEADFKRARSYYQLSPPYQLDQTDTEQAITNLRLYISRYPNGAHVEEAGRMIDELQNKLAHKQFAAGEMYERQRQYEAAALSYERVLEQYPNSMWAPRAMVGAIRAYIAYSDASIPSRQQERLDRAIETYERLIQIFPDNPVLKDAELLYEQALARQEALAGNTGMG